MSEEKTAIEIVGERYKEMRIKVSEYHDQNERVLLRHLNSGDMCDLEKSSETLVLASSRPKAYYDQAHNCVCVYISTIRRAIQHYDDIREVSEDFLEDIFDLINDAHGYREAAARIDVRNGVREDFYPMIDPEWYSDIRKES